MTHKVMMSIRTAAAAAAAAPGQLAGCTLTQVTSCYSFQSPPAAIMNLPPVHVSMLVPAFVTDAAQKHRPTCWIACETPVANQTSHQRI